VSSLAWGGSNIFLAAASISDPSFTASAAIQFGVFAAILLGCTLLCAYGTTLFARLQTPSVMLNVLLLLVTIIGLPIARRKELNTAAFTFGGWANLTGWPNVYAFIMSFLAPVWTICTLIVPRHDSDADHPTGSFDCAVSLSEEATNAATAVPQAIMGSIASAGVTGTIFLLICALTMGPDVAAVNDSEIGQPLAFIFQQGVLDSSDFILC
jgi:amino acid transporter